LDAPFLLMVAGPNGSGKTTLTRILRKAGVEFGYYINPDDIALELDGTYDARVLEAQRRADIRRDECIASKRSFSFETVMSHPSKIDILRRAKSSGFFVQLFFVGIGDPRANVARVASRVAQGGHDVPEDRIIARWHRTMGMLAEAIRAADSALVFDNTDSGANAAGPRLIVEFDGRPSGPVASAWHAPIPEWVRHFAFDPLGIDTA
jgi:predicted ABC-type ATPase